jgi:hypothetical protein
MADLVSTNINPAFGFGFTASKQCEEGHALFRHSDASRAGPKEENSVLSQRQTGC